MSKLSLKDKIKRLRPFVTFNYDLRANLENSLSRSQKAEITRYYNKVAAAITDQHIVYRPKTKTNAKKAAKYTGQTLPKLKAFAINSPSGAGRVKWRGGEAIIEKAGGFVRTIYPNQTLLATNPRAYLQALLRDDKLYIINSKNDWKGGGSKESVIARLVEAMEKYGWGLSDEEWLEERGIDPDGDDVEIEEALAQRKDRFTITILEVDLRNQDTFLEYKEKRRGKENERNEVARKARVRQRSQDRRDRANGKRPGYRRK